MDDYCEGSAQPRLSQANFRIERELWDRFKLEARRREGDDASSVLRRLIIEYLDKV